MSNQTFKKGDKVFSLNYGWGEVTAIYEELECPVEVQFYDWGYETFTEDGRTYPGYPMVLSFTEYTLEGFSLERPEVMPKKGDIVWSRDDKDDRYNINHFIHKIENAKYPYVCSPDNDEENIKAFKFITTINPYINEK